jgi:predicted ThiF/HesA family dinucleotide-utilizing enzyme
MSKLVISEEGKINIERMVLTIKIGLLTLLRKGIITIEEAENYFYSPYSAEKLEELGVDKKIVDLVYYGCELEDVESLTPERLDDVIDKITIETIEISKQLPRSELPTKKWIDWD